jgi:hypothetical protein
VRIPEHGVLNQRAAEFGFSTPSAPPLIYSFKQFNFRCQSFQGHRYKQHSQRLIVSLSRIIRKPKGFSPGLGSHKSPVRPAAL